MSPLQQMLILSGNCYQDAVKEGKKKQRSRALSENFKVSINNL